MRTNANNTSDNGLGSQHVPSGTRVLNTRDGEPGCIMNGFAFDPQVGWTEYEVETDYGVERWKREDFVLFTELEADA